jgi:hypothetical protein
MNLYDKASLILTPNAYKASKIHALKPTDGSGDLTFSRVSAAMRRNASGALESVANNIPRLHYPVVSGCPSWLFEPQRTNLLGNNNSIGGVGSGLTLSLSTWPQFPSLTLYDVSGLTNSNYLGSSPSLSSGAISLSFFIKKKTAVSIPFSIQYHLSGSDNTNFTINLDTGAVSAISGGSVTVVDTQNGYYRVAIVTTLAASRNQIRITAGAAGPYDCLITGFQLEVGSYVSAFIPTTTAAATRVADAPGQSNMMTNNYIGSSGFTAFGDVLVDNSSASPSAFGFFRIDDNSYNNYVGLELVNNGAVNFRYFTSGISRVTYTSATGVRANRFKFAFIVTPTRAAFFINGVKVHDVVIATSIPTMQNFKFSEGAGANIFHLTNLYSAMTFNSVLTDAECIALTT